MSFCVLEIVYWETRLQEQEEKLSILQEEVCHLERTHHEQEGELIQLDRRSFSEEVDLGRQEERTLRSHTIYTLFNMKLFDIITCFFYYV